jgi:hypothetical protein
MQTKVNLIDKSQIWANQPIHLFLVGCLKPLPPRKQCASWFDLAKTTWLCKRGGLTRGNRTYWGTLDNLWGEVFIYIETSSCKTLSACRRSDHVLLQGGNGGVLLVECWNLLLPRLDMVEKMRKFAWTYCWELKILPTCMNKVRMANFEISFKLRLWGDRMKEITRFRQSSLWVS